MSSPAEHEWRGFEAIRVTRAATSVAWFAGVVLLPTTSGLMAANAPGQGPELGAFAILTLFFGFWSGVVLGIFAIFIIWPACILALRWAPIAWPLAAAIGAAIGWIPGRLAIPEAPGPALITAAYGAVIGGVAAHLQLRWSKSRNIL